MTLTPEQLAAIRQQSSLVRNGRRLPILVLSGVTGGTMDQYTEEYTGETEAWVSASGVVSNIHTMAMFPQAGGTYKPGSIRISFDYEEIKGYEHALKMNYGGVVYSVDDKIVDAWADQITHIDFIVFETNG